jgi:biotin-(acetyl-CoA carboxylase) ligase
LGQAWEVPQASSLVLATVLRPPVPPEEADVGWLVAGLGALNGAEAVTGRELALWWPDRVIEGDVGSVVASIKAESQLGPGEVRASVVTVRLDLGRLGLGADRREELLEAVVGALDQAAGELDDASQGVAAAYEQRCALLGQRVKLRILPKGETRGTARGVDRGGGLELASATGMIERISVDMLRDLVLA